MRVSARHATVISNLPPRAVIDMALLSCHVHTAAQLGAAQHRRLLVTKPFGKSRPRVICRAELEEIDPMTGMPISAKTPTSAVAGNTLSAGGLTWAYRKSQPDNPSADKLDVLLLHGIASSSYSYRTTLSLLGGDGYTAYAPDWPGHGDSDKPSPGAFGYKEADYLKALQTFVDACGIRKPFALVVQGYILGNYGLLYALQNPDQVERLLILNTPLATNTKLRPELAAYKNPIAFMRPAKDKPFDGMMYNMTGSPYAWQEKDALVFGRPFKEEPAASAAVVATLEGVDWQPLLNKVDEGYSKWRKQSLLLFGADDPFISVKSAFDFLESKRTNMRIATASAKLGHMPQEDYPEALHSIMLAFLSGESDQWAPGKQVKMTKKGMVEV